MRRKLTLHISVLFLVGLLTSCGRKEGEVQPVTEGLSADAQKVVGYLLADWDQQFRSTSIPRAMENLGLKSNNELRLEIGQHFRNNPDLANNLQWWGANNYILSNEEKITAKFLINAKEDHGAMPDLPATAAATGLREDALKARLAFLTRTGLLVKSNEEKLGYTLVEGYEKWGGPLRFNFHTVAIADDKPFDVW